MMGKKMFVLAVVVLAVVGGVYFAVKIVTHGFSAREIPSTLETILERHARKIATPAGAKELKNPFTATVKSMNEAREHWVTHCSSCHGIDGRGDTTIGRNLYPKAPDMRDSETQRLTDGELYYIISNGVRFTGMPAWGAEDSPESIWALVAFLRRLPQLSPDELKLMEGLAAGGSTQAESAPTKPHTHAPGTKPHKH